MSRDGRDGRDIGDGVKLYEVQQSSNTTFRLYDWGRVGADGQSRNGANERPSSARIDLRAFGFGFDSLYDTILEMNRNGGDEEGQEEHSRLYKIHWFQWHYIGG